MVKCKPKKQRGKYLYMMLFPAKDPEDCEYHAITAGWFDSDEAAYFSVRDKYNLEGHCKLTRVVGVTDTKLNFVRYE